MAYAKSGLAALLAGLVLVGPASAQQTSGSKTVFESFGMVFDGKAEADGTSWFKVWEEDGRFLVEQKGNGSSLELWRLLRSASEANRAVRVRYDASAGRVNEISRTIDYPLCSVALDDIRFESGRSCSELPAILVPAALTAESALAFGFAELHGGSPQVALPLLDRALASGPHTPGFRQVALRARAEAYDAIANAATPLSEAADQAQIAALGDYRKLGDIAPDDVEVRFAIGSALENLGDYDSAKAEYEAILKRWSDEDFRVTVRLSAIARRLGDDERSLQLLNGIVERHGRQDGMKYHYHRGWTLTRLGRLDEAIASFNDGLATQPDYAWAIIRRGCARASLGQLSSALQDMEFGARKFAESVTVDDTTIRHDRNRMAAHIAALRTAVASGSTASMPAVCHGYSGRSDEARGKSALLNPSAKQAKLTQPQPVPRRARLAETGATFPGARGKVRIAPPLGCDFSMENHRQRNA